MECKTCMNVMDRINYNISEKDELFELHWCPYCGTVKETITTRNGDSETWWKVPSDRR